MTKRIIGAIGILITLFFFSGFLFLFNYNPQTLIEVDNVLSIASYNLRGMDGRWIAAYLIYLTVGLLNIAFGLGLLKLSQNDLPILLGKILIIIGGILWASFGIIPWDLEKNASVHIIMIRVISLLVIVPSGLLLLGLEFEKVLKGKFSKYYTIISGSIIFILGALSVLVFNDETWIRTNISLLIYFSWFGVIGLRLILSASAQQWL